MKKTNKTFKRFAAITSASLLAACAVMPAFTFAEETKLTMTVPKSATGSSLLPDGAIIGQTVNAYKIFEITPVENTDPVEYNVDGWGTGVKPNDLITAIKLDDTFKVGDANVFKDVTYNESESAKSAKAVGDALSKLNDEQKTAFAKVVMNNTSDTPTKTGDYLNGEVSFTDIADGYYIMTCTAKSGSTGEIYEATSLGMLTVVDGEGQIGLNGQAKVGLPTVQKKVYEDDKTATSLATHEKSDMKWNDVADYCIGEPVPFKLYGTMPSNIDMYESYYYKFTDNLDKKFDRPTSMTINVGDNTYNATYDDTKSKWSISNSSGGVVADNAIIIENNTENNGFTITFPDIKIQGAESDTLVTVSYNAVLNETANIGLPGQENQVKLEYSSNPNIDYNPNDSNNENDEPTIDETPFDEVIVYTYELDVIKEFKNADGTNADTPDDFDEITFSLSLPGTPATLIEFVLDGGYYYPATAFPTATAEQKVTTLNLNADSKILIKGLDAGTYLLNEVNGPDGFNEIGETTVTITAGTNHTQLWDGDATSGLTTFNAESLEGAAQDKDCILDVTITNTKGSTLPGTGGIGTTIFYLGGGAMAAIGGIYLISKRRMRKSEE